MQQIHKHEAAPGQASYICFFEDMISSGAQAPEIVLEPSVVAG